MIFEPYWDGVSRKVKIVFEGTSEAWEVYNRTINGILSDTRWWLDNLEFMSEYQIPQINYGKNRKFYRKNKQ